MKKLLWIIAMAVAANAGAATIGDIAAKQAELDSAELDAKIAKAKADTGVPSLWNPAKVMAAEKGDPSDAIVLNGIIGIGDDLRANVSINHVAVVMRKGDTVLGWKAESISDYEVSLTKEAKRDRRKITLRMMGAAPKSELPATLPGLLTMVPSLGMQAAPPAVMPAR